MSWFVNQYHSTFRQGIWEYRLTLGVNFEAGRCYVRSMLGVAWGSVKHHQHERVPGFGKNVPEDVLTASTSAVGDVRIFFAACGASQSIGRKSSASSSIRHWSTSSPTSVSTRWARKSSVSARCAARLGVSTVLCGTAFRRRSTWRAGFALPINPIVWIAIPWKSFSHSREICIAIWQVRAIIIALVISSVVSNLLRAAGYMKLFFQFLYSFAWLYCTLQRSGELLAIAPGLLFQ